MKLTTEQQNEISRHLQKVALNKAAYSELYDHILTSLTQQPESKQFEIRDIQDFIHQEFDELINTPEEKKRFSLLNTIVGLVIFLIALCTYWSTMEPTVSFWDCGEFIAAATKIQVGHQPGAPLFLMIGKLFSLLALGNTNRIAYWVNFSTVVASAGTIMFLFWTITNIAVSVFHKEKLKTRQLSILIAGAIGALAFCFSDSFWFSAVEAEVYALSTLFTAITFWAIIKWEAEMNDRWLILIAFIVGLSTGVHLLSLLTIPAVAMIYYFRKTDTPNWIGTCKAFAIGCVIVAFVQFVVLQYFVLIAAKADFLFVNSFALPFGSGGLFFITTFLIVMVLAIRYSINKGLYNLNLGLLCGVFLFFGFSSYSLILIRANAKTNINLSNPDNLFGLYGYLGRTNYVPAPLLYGQTFDAKSVENEVTGNTYRKGEKRYEISGETYKTTYDKNMLFPRMYSQDADDIGFYQRWLGLTKNETPTFTQNLQFFASWQINEMYLRYFLWNFAGKQNDEQGYGGPENGNWITGIKPLDELRLGSQKNLPESITTNAGHNTFYAFPLILGIAGLIWLYRKNRNYALTLLALFTYTGIAIIVFLNQDPLQVRERDYAYVGSFYAFAIFIGFGVFALSGTLRKLLPAKISFALTSIVCLVAVPLLMATQGWDDHNRSAKTTAVDWAKNYLNSCAPNAILFTNADNDTYPLWYAQEVEGIRPDIRVICMQFLKDGSFINSLKEKINHSDPLPITMANTKYANGTRDYMPYYDYGIGDSVELADLVAVMTSENLGDKVKMQDGSYINFLPTKKLTLSINKNEVVNSGTLAPQQRENIPKSIDWTFNKSYADKGDLALFDILAHNQWKRPIYFATSVSSDTYIGLDRYLYLEGYAYRLLPLTPDPKFVNKESQVNADVMYTNIAQKYDLTGFKKATYLDPESRRIASTTWRLNNTLTAALISIGQHKKAEKIMEKSLRDLPLHNYSIGDTLNKVYTIQNLYALNQTKIANALATDTARYIQQELEYVAQHSPRFKSAYLDNVEFGVGVMNELTRVTSVNHQSVVSKQITDRLQKLSLLFNVN